MTVGFLGIELDQKLNAENAPLLSEKEFDKLTVDSTPIFVAGREAFLAATPVSCLLNQDSPFPNLGAKLTKISHGVRAARFEQCADFCPRGIVVRNDGNNGIALQ
jgi:hypothetical protein